MTTTFRRFALSKKIASGCVVLAFAASWIHPPWPQELLLQSVLTLLCCATLAWVEWRYPLPVRDFCLMAAFMCLHCVAARWLYSNVPYDQWWQALSGHSLHQALGWQRNHFDRLVHLAYGICFTPPLVTLARKRWPVNQRHAAMLAVAGIVCSSVLYEWFEWLIALVLSPEQAEGYNGQQGDMWDAHKDMLLATLGSLLWLPVAWKNQKAN